MQLQRSILAVLLIAVGCGEEWEDSPAVEGVEEFTDVDDGPLVVITAPPPGSPEALQAELEADQPELFEPAVGAQFEEPVLEVDEFIAEEEDHDFEFFAEEDDHHRHDESEEFETTISALARPIQRPHWGSAKHGDNRCSASSHRYHSTKYNTMSVYRWGGCHQTVYYRIGASIRERGPAWVTAVERAFAAWDLGKKCSPHWVNITRAPAGTRPKVEVEMRGANGHCHSDSTWYACVIRDRAASATDQHWWMNLNTAVRIGVGVRGRLDVQSLVTVELAHILYAAHNPNYDDSVSTSNVARWGTTSVSLASADSCSIRPYTAHCTNCGNRRSLLVGDRALINHLYASRTNGCTNVGSRVYGCNGDPDNYRICRSTHTWSACLR